MLREKKMIISCYVISWVKRKTTQPDIFGTKNHTHVKCIYSSFSKM